MQRELAVGLAAAVGLWVARAVVVFEFRFEVLHLLVQQRFVLEHSLQFLQNEALLMS